MRNLSVQFERIIHAKNLNILYKYKSINLYSSEALINEIVEAFLTLSSQFNQSCWMFFTSWMPDHGLMVPHNKSLEAASLHGVVHPIDHLSNLFLCDISLFVKVVHMSLVIAHPFLYFMFQTLQAFFVHQTTKMSFLFVVV